MLSQSIFDKYHCPTKFTTRFIIHSFELINNLIITIGIYLLCFFHSNLS